jgi:hypothetical protein
MAISKAGQIAVPITHTPDLTASANTSGASNIPMTSFAELGGLTVSMDDLEATGAGGFCIGVDGEFHTTSAPLSKSHAAFMTPIREMACNTAGDAIDTSYGFPAFTTAGTDFDITAATAGFGADFSTSSGFGDLDMTAAATMDDSQMLSWDDADLTFNMDMDMDIDLGIPATSGA